MALMGVKRENVVDLSVRLFMRMNNRWLVDLTLLIIGVLLLWGCFGLFLFPFREEKSYGRRLEAKAELFSKLVVNTDLTPGEATVQIEKGWLVRQQVGFFVLGGMQQIALDRVTITTSLKAMADVSAVRLEDLLPSSGKMPRFTLAKAYRIEFKTLKAEGGRPFFRAMFAEVPLDKGKPIILQDAWFHENGMQWEPLERAWIVADHDVKKAHLQLLRKSGELFSLPLGVTL